jgi:hypothetical protein
MEAGSEGGKVYLVRRRPDRWGYHRGMAGPVQRAFTERGAAEAYRQECDRQAWLDRRPVLEALTDPATFQSPFELTSFDPPVFLDWLVDADIRLPPDDLRATLECVEWWESCRQLSDLQWLRLFEALDKVRFYEITEVELSADGGGAALPDYGRILGGEGRPEWREEPEPGDYDTGFDGSLEQYEPLDSAEQYGGDDIPF